MRVKNKNNHDLLQDFIKIINQMELANDFGFQEYFAQIKDIQLHRILRLYIKIF